MRILAFLCFSFANVFSIKHERCPGASLFTLVKGNRKRKFPRRWSLQAKVHQKPFCNCIILILWRKRRIKIIYATEQIVGKGVNKCITMLLFGLIFSAHNGAQVIRVYRYMWPVPDDHYHYQMSFVVEERLRAYFAQNPSWSCLIIHSLIKSFMFSFKGFGIHVWFTVVDIASFRTLPLI